MKHRILIPLAAAAITSMFAFTSCSKNMQQDLGNRQTSAQFNSKTSSVLSGVSGDRIDSIMKGVLIDNYSLSFDNAIPSAGITRTAYGADNYYVFADPQILICPEPFKYKLKKVPVWRIPKSVQPTCLDMIRDAGKLKQIQDVLVKVDPAQFNGLKQLQLQNGGGLLATERLYSQYSSIKSDRVDEITKDADPEKFVILGASDYDKGGVFTRNFYGYADLNSLVFTPYKTSLNLIFKPTLKGCFDPRVLKNLKDKLAELNPTLYKSLNVTSLPQNGNIALLSY